MCDFDVFISYNWDHKAQVRKLYDHLMTSCGLKCWLDDVELKPNALMDELAKGITNSKVFVCCITKQYCKSANCIGEINHARNLNKPMDILMFERLSIDKLGGIGFIIGPMIRTNVYKFNELFDEPTGELFKQCITSINAKLDEWNSNAEPGEKPSGGAQAAVMNDFVRSLNGHSGAVLCLQELTKDRLASGSSDFSVIIWNLKDFTTIKKLDAHSDLVTCLKKLPEGRLASGSMDSTIVIWNLSSYEPIKVLKGHTEGITCLKVLPDKELCSGSNDYCLRIWNMKTYDCVKEIRGHVKRHKKVFMDTKKKFERLIESTIFKSKPSAAASSSTLNSAASTLTTDGSAVSDATLDTKESKDTAESESVPTILEADENKEEPISYDQAVARSERTESTITSNAGLSNLELEKNTVKLRKKASDASSIADSDVTVKKKSRPKFLQKKQILKFIKTKDRESMDSGMSAVGDGNDDVIDDDAPVNDDDFIPEENEDDLKEGEDQIDVIDEDVDDKKKKKINDSINKLAGHTKSIYCLKNIKSQDAKTERTRFASGSGDKLIKIWDLINYNCVSTLKGHTSIIICLKNLPKNRIASGSSDKTIRIWELNKFTCIKVLTGHTSDIQCLQLLPNNRLASGSCDTTIRIWNLTGKFECTKVIKEHTKYVNILKKLKTDRLISSSNDNLIKIWDIKTGTYECIETFKEHARWISFIFVLDNGKICSCSWDSSIKVWKAATLSV